MSKKLKLYRVVSIKHRTGSTSSIVGTLEELIKAYSYTLDCGRSWEHEKGNKKINCQPKGIKSLISNLNKAVVNSAANGCPDNSYYWEPVGLSIEIASKSKEVRLNWADAKAFSDNTGKCWRLPSEDELKLIFKYENDFEKDYYWTSWHNSDIAVAVQFKTGSNHIINSEKNTAFVRLVRSLAHSD